MTSGVIEAITGAVRAGRRDAAFGKPVGRRFRRFPREDLRDLGEIVLPIEHAADRAEIMLASAKYERRERVETIA
jgi:hypothetical protein